MGRGRTLGAGAASAMALVLVAAGAAVGVLNLPSAGDESETVAAPVGATVEPTPVQAVAGRTLEPKPYVAKRGDEGAVVRDIQARLAQVFLYSAPVTGDFDRATVQAVKAFQEDVSAKTAGVVDKRTWRLLQKATVTPTRAQLRHEVGETLYAEGASGTEVRAIEARLRQIAWFFGDVDDSFDAQTTEAVRGFQGKRGIPITGEIDQTTLDLLLGMTTEPTEQELANTPVTPSEGVDIDPRCATGRVLCIDKTTNSLRWVIDGDVQMDLEVRFGSAELPTREGEFSVFYKSRDHVSSLYDTSMPFAMFFSGGQAVHYSPDFAANGYAGASHGCVNVRDYDAITSLFDQVVNGDKVVVYWS